MSDNGIVCCRNCGTDLRLTLANVSIDSGEFGGFHLKASVPVKQEKDGIVVLKPHHKSDKPKVGVTKISKVICSGCDCNLGNVQRMGKEDDTWYLKCTLKFC